MKSEGAPHIGCPCDTCRCRRVCVSAGLDRAAFECWANGEPWTRRPCGKQEGEVCELGSESEPAIAKLTRNQVEEVNAMIRAVMLE